MNEISRSSRISLKIDYFNIINILNVPSTIHHIMVGIYDCSGAEHQCINVFHSRTGFEFWIKIYGTFIFSRWKYFAVLEAVFPHVHVFWVMFLLGNNFLHQSWGIRQKFFISILTRLFITLLLKGEKPGGVFRSWTERVVGNEVWKPHFRRSRHSELDSVRVGERLVVSFLLLLYPSFQRFLLSIEHSSETVYTGRDLRGASGALASGASLRGDQNQTAVNCFYF